MDAAPKPISGAPKPVPISPTKDRGNPLLINEVLENLFEMLPTKSIKQFRTVCRIWNAEGLRTMRKRVRLNLGTIPRQLEFMKKSPSSNFKNYDFVIANWNEDVAEYLKVMQPNTLETSIKFFLNQEYKETGIEIFDDLITSFGDRLTKLEIKAEWDETARFKIPDHLLHQEFPQLIFLSIKSGYFEPTWINPLWIAMVNNSHNLEELQLFKLPDRHLWSGLIVSPTFIALRKLTFVPEAKLDLAIMNQPVNFHFSQLSHLTIEFKLFRTPREVRSLLEQVSQNLEHLKFITANESALSPLTFPEMPNLLSLDSGKAVISFPSITPDVFPKLREIRQTYWDWISTLENLPGLYHYWETENPHSGVRYIDIKFPEYTSFDIAYTRLENFQEFANAVKTKFPRGRRFTFHNVALRNDMKTALDTFFTTFQDSVVSFKISSYNFSELDEPSTFEMYRRALKSRCNRFKELDLGTIHWPKIWKKNPGLFSTIPGPEWIPFLAEYRKLRVIKLLWAEGILNLLRLNDYTLLQNLEVLEFVGDRCVDRKLCYDICMNRPNLSLIQHRECYCQREDWWYMFDPFSGRIFKNLLYPV